MCSLNYGTVRQYRTKIRMVQLYRDACPPLFLQRNNDTTTEQFVAQRYGSHLCKIRTESFITSFLFITVSARSDSEQSSGSDFELKSSTKARRAVSTRKKNIAATRKPTKPPRADTDESSCERNETSDSQYKRRPMSTSSMKNALKNARTSIEHDIRMLSGNNFSTWDNFMKTNDAYIEQNYLCLRIFNSRKTLTFNKYVLYTYLMCLSLLVFLSFA